MTGEYGYVARGELDETGQVWVSHAGLIPAMSLASRAVRMTYGEATAWLHAGTVLSIAPTRCVWLVRIEQP